MNESGHWSGTISSLLTLVLVVCVTVGVGKFEQDRVAQSTFEFETTERKKEKFYEYLR